MSGNFKSQNTKPKTIAEKLIFAFNLKGYYLRRSLNVLVETFHFDRRRRF